MYRGVGDDVKRLMFLFSRSFWFQHHLSNMTNEFPLHDAALRGDFEKVKQLLENAYPVDTKDREGSTALY
jgi:ankyrin repeat protein